MTAGGKTTTSTITTTRTPTIPSPTIPPQLQVVVFTPVIMFTPVTTVALLDTNFLKRRPQRGDPGRVVGFISQAGSKRRSGGQTVGQAVALYCWASCLAAAAAACPRHPSPSTWSCTSSTKRRGRLVAVAFFAAGLFSLWRWRSPPTCGKGGLDGNFAVVI